VKVQVARADVQRALAILGAGVAATPAASKITVAGDNPPRVKLKQLKDRDPTVPIIVVISLLVAALILSMS
jgi:hypothetical protein